MLRPCLLHTSSAHLSLAVTASAITALSLLSAAAGAGPVHSFPPPGVSARFSLGPPPPSSGAPSFLFPPCFNHPNNLKRGFFVSSLLLRCTALGGFSRRAAGSHLPSAAAPALASCWGTCNGCQACLVQQSTAGNFSFPAKTLLAARFSSDLELQYKPSNFSSMLQPSPLVCLSPS